MASVIQQGSVGTSVSDWQTFLVGRGYSYVIIDGNFGPNTTRATKSWQYSNFLRPDGVVGEKSYIVALSQGLAVHNNGFPDKPATFSAYVSNDERNRIFGKFAYVADPQPDNPEQIRVTDDWADRNLVHASTPLLAKLKLQKRDYIICHRLFAPRVEAFFADIDAAGLGNRIIAWDGCYVPRFIRGSRTTLSNHAWGTAFDINADDNALGHQAASVGQRGSVVELVPLAIKHGLFWGQWYEGRKDPMHFEHAKTF